VSGARYPDMPSGACRESSWILAACYPELEYVEGTRTMILHVREEGGTGPVQVIRDEIEHAWNVTPDGKIVDSTTHPDIRSAVGLVVEPYATDTVGGNLNPVGRVYYNASTMLCVPNALSQPGGYTLGAQAGEAAIRQVLTDAGFTRFRRAAETPFNLVYEIRP
jgi:hypothetical protein